MDDSCCLRFFLEPTDTLHRRYEALRAYFVERRPLQEIAQQFGYTYNTLRQVDPRLPGQCRSGAVPPFSPPRRGRPRPSARSRPSPDDPAVADRGGWTWPGTPPADSGRRHLPLPALAGSPPLRPARRSGRATPARRWCPPPRALLSLLALKLLDKERRSHISDFNFDEALGLFAGLNVLPKATTPPTTPTAPSGTTSSDSSPAGSPPWHRCCSPRDDPSPWTSTPSPSGAIPPPWRTTSCPAAARPAQRPQLLRPGAGSRVLCYANANLTRADQPGELMRFVEFWHGADRARSRRGCTSTPRWSPIRNCPASTGAGFSSSRSAGVAPR